MTRDAAGATRPHDAFLARHRLLGVLAALFVLLTVGIITGEVVGRLLAYLVGLLVAAASGGSSA